MAICSELEKRTVPVNPSVWQIFLDDSRSFKGLRDYFTEGTEGNQVSSINIDKLKEFQKRLRSENVDEKELLKCSLRHFHEMLEKLLSSDISNIDENIDIFAIVTDLIVLTKAPIPLLPLVNMHDRYKLVLIKHWSTFDDAMFTLMVKNVRSFWIKNIKEGASRSSQLEVAEYYKLLYCANIYIEKQENDCNYSRKYEIDNEDFYLDLHFSDPLLESIASRSSAPKIPYEKFVMPELRQISTEAETHDLVHHKETLIYLRFPFIFSTQFKIRLLNNINSSIMSLARISSGYQTEFHVLRVSRDNLVKEALENLNAERTQGFHVLRLKLYLEFDQEIGQDGGGVVREFFNILIKRMVSSEFELFTAKEGGFYWLRRNDERKTNTYSEFKLFGALLGLALYNNVLVNVKFPNVFYQKLLGQCGTLNDLYDFDPNLAANLSEILKYSEDDFEDVFMLNFTASVENVDGTIATFPLKENGENISVTHANKREYVQRYVDVVLNESVDQEFGQLISGFGSTVSLKLLKQLFRPEELNDIMRGPDIIDVDSLENGARYGGIHSPNYSSTVRYFWEVVREMSESEKRTLLKFITSSDRVPLGGIEIWNAGSETEKLPWTNTCAYRINLPEYTSESELKEKLFKAISYSEGFGLA